MDLSFKSQETKILPPPLKAYGCIGVLAPASAPDLLKLERGISELKALGYRLKVADQVYMKDELGFAGSDYLRAESLMDFFKDPEVDCLWMARGGYGSMRLFSLLDPFLIRAFPKRLMGYSDISFLLAYLWKFCDISAIHGPCLLEFPDFSKEDRKLILKSLSSADALPLNQISSLDVLQKGSASGPLFAFNLSILLSILSTPLEPDLNGAILLIEDVNEAPYKIERMIGQLALSGLFKKISGLLLGSFQGCGEKEEIYRRILHFLPPELPLMAGLPSGHGNNAYGKKNLPLAWGLKALMDSSKRTLFLFSPYT